MLIAFGGPDQEYINTTVYQLKKQNSKSTPDSQAEHVYRDVCPTVTWQTLYKAECIPGSRTMAVI